MIGGMRKGRAARGFWSLALILFGLAGVARAQQPWSERLGYPADSRVVILYAQGLGTCGEMDVAVSDLMENGHLQSAGVLAPAPWFDDAAAICRDHANCDIGLSLTVNSTWPMYRFRPVSDRSQVPSLVDTDGFLTSSLMQFSMNADAEQVEHELEAQITRAREAGLQPTHFSPYEGALLARPDLLEVYLKLSRKYWIPSLLVELTPEHIRRFRDAGVPLRDDEISLITNYPLPKLDDLRFAPSAQTYEDKRNQFYALVDSLQPGITQITFRPASESDALKRLTPDWQQRVWDAQLLADPEVTQYLEEKGIRFTSWGEMMRRFESGGSADVEAEEEAAAAEEEAEYQRQLQGSEEAAAASSR